MLTSLIFDLDGVLVDSHPAHRRTWMRVVESAGFRIHEKELEFVLEGRRRDEILRHLMGDLSPRELATYGRMKDQFFMEECAAIKTVEGVGAFLRELASSDISMAVASCGSSARILSQLEKLGLRTFFKVIVGGDQVFHGKPHPEVYLKAMHELNVNCSEAVAVEDSASGVLAARAAGLTCLGIGAEHQVASLLAAGAARVVPSFAGLDTTAMAAMLAREGAQRSEQASPANFGQALRKMNGVPAERS